MIDQSITEYNTILNLLSKINLRKGDNPLLKKG